MEALAAAGEPVDLVRDFATPIPSLTICELLGIPYEERDEFQALSTARFDLFGGAGAVFDNISGSLQYLRGVVERQRIEPGEGLLGQLIREHGDELDTDELAELADGLLTGGLETSASMLALGAMVAAARPRQLRPRARRAGGRERLRRGAAALPDRRPDRVPAVRHRGHDPRRRRDQQGRRAARVALGRRPRPAPDPGPRALRPPPRPDAAPGLRARHPPLHRRRARPHGAARGLPGPPAPLPGACASPTTPAPSTTSPSARPRSSTASTPCRWPCADPCRARLSAWRPRWRSTSGNPPRRRDGQRRADPTTASSGSRSASARSKAAIRSVSVKKSSWSTTRPQRVRSTSTVRFS